MHVHFYRLKFYVTQLHSFVPACDVTRTGWMLPAVERASGSQVPAAANGSGPLLDASQPDVAHWRLYIVLTSSCRWSFPSSSGFYYYYYSPSSSLPSFLPLLTIRARRHRPAAHTHQPPPVHLPKSRRIPRAFPEISWSKRRCVGSIRKGVCSAAFRPLRLFPISG